MHYGGDSRTAKKNKTVRGSIFSIHSSGSAQNNQQYKATLNESSGLQAKLIPAEKEKLRYPTIDNDFTWQAHKLHAVHYTSADRR